MMANTIPSLLRVIKATANRGRAASSLSSFAGKSIDILLANPVEASTLSSNSNISLPIKCQYRQLSSMSKENLLELLERELTEENENHTCNMPDELSQLKNQISESWRIVDGSAMGVGVSGATIKMFRKEPILGGAKVSITFHCQDTLDAEEALGGIFGGEDEGDENEELSASFRFTVNIARAGKNMRMVCFSEDAAATVESVSITGEDEDSDEELYQGPEFTELAEDLQKAFTSYLRNECGVDEDVAVFIAMYSDFKEQTEYIGWLKDVRNILA